MPPNTVFISYAHESDAHRERVLTLARALLQAGWDVALDRYVGHPSGGWPRWMADQVDRAHRILCICTPTYRDRFEGEQARSGLGVSWEGYLLTGMLYRARGRAEHIVPVWPAGHDEEAGVGFLPLVLRPLPGLAFDVDAIVRRLGSLGPARSEPTPTAGWDPGAMDANRVLGQLYRPVRPRQGGSGPHDVPPSTFLRPEHAIVPFHGREAELAELDRWCEGGDLRVRVVHGAGGVGKTRLALELSARRAREGWRAGPLVPGALTREGADALVRDPIPLLVCVDYAETRLGEVALLLQQAAANAVGPVRALLLARHVGDWVDALARDVRELPDLLDEPVLVEGEVAQGVALAAAAFAAYFRRDVPTLLPTTTTTPLEAQVDALLAVRGDAGRGIEALVNHEEAYLLGVARSRGVRVPVAERLPKAMALVTLAQGWPAADATAWLQAVPRLGKVDEIELSQALEVLVTVYPAGAGDVAPVRPDRVGEVYVARHDPDGGLAGITCERGAAVAALTVLTRLAQRGGVDRPLRAVLEARLELVVEAVSEVGVAVGDPIGSLAAEVLERRGDVGLAERVEPLLPERSVALRELAVAASRLQLTGLGTVDGDSADDLVAKWARQLNNLGIRLSDLGRREEALAAAAAAVDVYRGLVARRPEAFLPGLAVSLDSLGIALAALGRREEAMAAAAEAVVLLRGLAARRPAAFLPDLASSLNQLGNVLSSLGRREDALAAAAEAVHLRRGLSARRPAAFLPALATSLNNLGNRLSDLGRREEALTATAEAVHLRRGLSARRPDAFLPDLASSLNNLGNRLSSVGRRDEALAAMTEAVELYRGLAARRPDAFLADLARSLNNMSNMLSELERREEALAAIAEAVEVHRGLVARRPDAFLSDFSLSLNNLGNRLSSVGRHEEALAAIAEAVGLHRSLAVGRPDWFSLDLARSLTSLSNQMWALGLREEGLAAAAEAVGVCRGLAGGRPNAFLSDLAGCLHVLGVRLSDLGRHEEALTAAAEAVEALRDLATRQPAAFLSRLAASLRILGITLSALGRSDEALAKMVESVELLRGLSARSPSVFLPELARSLGAMGQIQLAAERPSEAAVSFRKGMTVLVPFALRRAQAHVGMLRALARDYVRACEAAGFAPDPSLLAHVRAVLPLP
jgi:tetratricopeptide (TPR) repeat protein